MTKEQENYFKKIVKGHTVNEIIDLYYKKYGEKMSVGHVRYLKKDKYKLCSGVNTKFQKNQEAHNHKEIESEFIDKRSGYIFIKTKEPNTWIQKQRYVWEKYKGKIPDGYSIIFLDGNKLNCDIDNLMMVENRDKLVAKNLHLFSKQKEITKTGINIAKLINKTSDKRRMLNGNS